MTDTDHPDLDPETQQFILKRARVASRELAMRISSAAEALAAGSYRPVLGDLVLAEVQLLHLRCLVRILAA